MELDEEPAQGQERMTYGYTYPGMGDEVLDFDRVIIGVCSLSRIRQINLARTCRCPDGELLR